MNSEFLIVKALVDTFKKEKAFIWTFSRHCKFHEAPLTALLERGGLTCTSPPRGRRRTRRARCRRWGGGWSCAGAGRPARGGCAPDTGRCRPPTCSGGHVTPGAHGDGWSIDFMKYKRLNLSYCVLQYLYILGKDYWDLATSRYMGDWSPINSKLLSSVLTIKYQIAP